MKEALGKLGDLAPERLSINGSNLRKIRGGFVKDTIRIIEYLKNQFVCKNERTLRKNMKQENIEKLPMLSILPEIFVLFLSLPQK